MLGVVHNLNKPVTGEFGDYIAIPGQWLISPCTHGAGGRHGVPIGSTVRSRMDDLTPTTASRRTGLQTRAGATCAGNQSRANRWVKGLLEFRRQAGRSLRFIEHVGTDLFPDEIYVFTPNSEIIEL
ncbi:MAG: hypothetical protein IPK48_15165 [Gammaproteobacteria bacterium]|nr:hypothetical protein [Gammaproteobacteria bacterium]